MQFSKIYPFTCMGQSIQEWTNLRKTVFKNLKGYGLLKQICLPQILLVHSWILCPLCFSFTFTLIFPIFLYSPYSIDKTNPSVKSELVLQVVDTQFNPLLRSAVKWSDTLLKSCSICCKIFKVRLTILQHCEEKG